MNENTWRSVIESAEEKLSELSWFFPEPEDEDCIILIRCYVRRLEKVEHEEVKHNFTPQGARHAFVEMLADLGPSVYPSTPSSDPIPAEDWTETLSDEAVNAYYWRFPEIAAVLFPEDFAKRVIEEFDAFNGKVDEQTKRAEARRAAGAL